MGGSEHACAHRTEGPRGYYLGSVDIWPSHGTQVPRKVAGLRRLREEVVRGSLSVPKRLNPAAAVAGLTREGTSSDSAGDPRPSPGLHGL